MIPPTAGQRMALFLGVLELRHRLDGLLGRAGQDLFPVLLLQLADWNRHVVSGKTDEPAGADNDEGDGPVRRDDDVVAPPDPREYHGAVQARGQHGASAALWHFLCFFLRALS